MLREIYAIPENETRYKPNVVELTNPIDVIIQQIDLLLFTNTGEVLMAPDFGCNLEQYLFETSWNEEVIKNIVKTKIRNYIYNPYGFSIDVGISFVKWDFNVAMVVDIYIDDKKVTSYLV